MREVALNTGAGCGIGLGIATCLAAEGCDIVVCDIRAEETVKDTLDELRKMGADVLYCLADVSDPEARSCMVSEIRVSSASQRLSISSRPGRIPAPPALPAQYVYAS